MDLTVLTVLINNAASIAVIFADLYPRRCTHLLTDTTSPALVGLTMFGETKEQKGSDDPFGVGDQTSVAEKELLRKNYDDIVQVLLSGGYFRVRIASLKPFDKVVGGLCWAITSSGADVDVDLYYDETLPLGRKIQLSEKVVWALREMKCPFVLQANQIQGSDFAALAPIIKWLVRAVIEYRQATGNNTRDVSEVRWNGEFGIVYF